MFKVRSYKKELLDGDNIPDAHLYRNLQELHIINKLLGGYRISLRMLRRVLQPGREYVLADIGCGGGDTLRQIKEWNKNGRYTLSLCGIDLKQTCIDYAMANNGAGLHFICDDYRNVLTHISRVDVLHACLFCHHLTEDEIVDLIRFCRDNNITLMINDLERNAIAYYAISILTRLFSRSYLVRHDAPLSVARGFTSAEWQAVLERAGAQRYSISRRWAFRHEVIVYAN